MKSSLKDLARKATGPEHPTSPANDTAPEPVSKSYRTAQTRSDTRQVSGHFKPEVAQTLRLIAVEQDRDVQEVLAEALNMLFERYGKATRVDVTSGRRKKLTT
jgi:hypothetical protein